MGEDLVQADVIAKLLSTQVTPYAQKSALIELTGSAFLPFIRVMGGNSEEVKEGKFPIGHFGLQESRASIIDLGEEFIMMVLSWRPKAMQYQPEIISVFDHESELFKAIQSTADVPKSGKGYGPEFLIWLPDYERFATYFFGNKTARNEAPNVVRVFQSISRICKQQIHLIRGREHTWHAMRTLPYDVPIKMPEPIELQKELENFNNPPTPVVREIVEDEDTDRD